MAPPARRRWWLAAVACAYARLWFGPLAFVAPSGHQDVCSAHSRRGSPAGSRSYPRLLRPAAFLAPNGHQNAGSVCYLRGRLIESRPSPRTLSGAAIVPGDASPTELPGCRGSVFWWVRLRVFIGLLLGYSTFYICRVSLNYAGPTLVTELGVDLAQIGALQSAGQISVGLNKLISGVLASDFSPSKLLAGGLLLTGVTNACVGLLPALAPTSFTIVLVCMWMLNGIWQGVGSPSCARVVDAWFLPSERGTYWALWNTSNNLGGALAPLVVAVGVAFGGWRWGFGMPGSIAICMSLFLLLAVRDNPQAAGFSSAVLVPQQCPAEAASNAPASQAKGWQLLWDGVLRQPGFAKLALANVMIYMIRAGLQSWGSFFMLRSGSPLHLGEALAVLGLFEVGGLCGSIAGGTLSDVYLARCPPEHPMVGGRMEVALLFTLGLAAVLGGFLFMPASCAGSPATAMLVAGAGFFLYGPQALVALCGMELVPRRAVGASQGVLGLSAYFGAAMAGLPVALLLRGRFGWSAWRTVMCVCVVGVALTLISLRSAKSREQCFQEDCLVNGESAE